MMHMIAYASQASYPTPAPLIPIPDPTLRVAGNDFYVPAQVNQIISAAGLINSTVAPARMQIQSPSLRALLNFDLGPVANSNVFGSLPRCMRMWQTPLQLVTNEPLDMYCQNAASVLNQAMIILSDGPVKPVTGKIYSVRATGSAVLQPGQWVNTPLTFSQTLPSGHYQCVGFRAIGVTLVGARIFFVGGAWRPGVYASNSVNDNDWPDFRYGNIGVWGEFDNTVPPTVDCNGFNDTSQDFVFDLIKTA
jgi:hypothetical protein